MNAVTHPPRGGATVGTLDDLDPVEAGAVRALRLWSAGAEGQLQVWCDFAEALGTGPARQALKAFEGLWDLCMRHARRPLMRHKPGCACLCADEACFAAFVGAASTGEREDALMIGAAMVRADVAFLMIGEAEAFGLALRRGAAAVEAAAQRPGRGDTVH